MTTSTIFARASGGGRAGVAVFRISGPLAASALSSLAGKIGQPRYAQRATFRARSGDTIDDGLTLWFPGPASFTGEDVVELHIHGSPAVELMLSAELQALGCEPAGPGAFTMRAFSNGKFDLTQAEGLADLLEAETALQHKQAMQHYSGALRERADSWRASLIEAMAMLEASVDFPDEEGVPGEIANGAQSVVQRIITDLADVLAGASRAQKLAEGVTVAIVGPPNAGKSSLFNEIINEERAIVSDEAGTTRDVVSATIELSGHRVTILDTAGIRTDGTTLIEEEGIKRATAAAERADLRLLCSPAASAVPAWLDSLKRTGDIALRTRADEGGHAEADQMLFAINQPKVLKALLGTISERLDGIAAPGLAPSDRHVALISEALQWLDKFEQAALLAPEAGSEALRLASRALEALTGRIATDDVLDDIFSSFCIGK